MEKNRKSLKRSIITGIIIFILSLCIILSVAQYFGYRSMLYSRYEAYIESILDYVAGEIDVDDLAECIRTGQESDGYRKLQKTLDSIKERVNIHFIYVIVPLNTEPVDNIRNVIAGATQYEYENEPDELVYLNMPTGDSYTPETAKKYLDAFFSGKLTFFEEVSQWGDDYTGLLPLTDSTGKKVAALCVDVDIAQIHGALLNRIVLGVLLIILVGLAFAVSFYLWASRNVTRPIEQLESSVVEFAANCQDQKDPDVLKIQVPSINTENEVAHLADAVAQMSEAMREYIKNIAYTESELARMIVLANKDPLTNVRNKNGFDAYTIELQARMRKEEIHFAVLMVDANYLKQINDTYGHEKGDIYIRQCCEVICVVFDHSPVFRIGGDEFAVILLGQDYSNRHLLLSNVRDTFQTLMNDKTLEPWERGSVAIGIAEYQPETDQSVEDVLRRADQDMYNEKQKMKAEL